MFSSPRAASPYKNARAALLLAIALLANIFFSICSRAQLHLHQKVLYTSTPVSKEHSPSSLSLAAALRLRVPGRTQSALIAIVCAAENSAMAATQQPKGDWKDLTGSKEFDAGLCSCFDECAVCTHLLSAASTSHPERSFWSF